MCNYMKKQWSQESFIALCGHIATYKRRAWCHFIYNRLPNSISETYSQYRSRARNRSYDFELDEDMFNLLLS